jgi:hypothetical protein
MMIMNERIWYAYTAVIFLSVFLTATLSLLSPNHVTISNAKSSFVAGSRANEKTSYPVYRTQSPGSSVTDCIDNLMNKIGSGDFDLGSLRQEIENCFEMGLGNGTGNGTDLNNGNGTEIVPQTPSQLSPKFV